MSVTAYLTDSGGFLHSETEPAVVRADGRKEWWIHGKRIKSQKHLQEHLNLTDEEMLKYVLVNGSFS